MGKAGKMGICHICGRRGRLSFEHIPPRSMGNTRTAKIYSTIEMVKSDYTFDLFNRCGIKYRQQQQGMGYQTICKDCNSYLGTNYVEAFTGCMLELADTMLSHPRHETEAGIHLDGHEVNVLAFVKQVIANFCTVTQAGSMDECSAFLLDKTSNDFPNRFKLFMFAVPDEDAGFISTGWLQIIVNAGLYETLRVAALAYFPVGFYLLDRSASNIEPSSIFGCDITPMTKVPWGEKPQFAVDLPYMTIRQGFPHPICLGE